MIRRLFSKATESWDDLRKNLQARFGSVAMAVPSQKTYRMVANYRAVESLIAPLATPMPNLEIGRKITGASVVCTLDLLHV